MTTPPGPETPRQRLKRIRGMIETGLLSEPRAGLEAMSRDPALRSDPSLGTPTLLGYPRKLHSAWLKLAKAEGNPVDRIGLQHALVPPPSLLAPLAVLDGTTRRAMNEVNRHPVPRILHQIWLGDLPLPPAIEAWRRHADLNGLEYRLWREADLEELGVPLHAAYLQMLEAGDYPGAVDIARYFVLHAVGGIYLDCDWYPARDDVSFADFLPLIGLSALAEDTPRETGAGSLLLTNSFLATPAGHPAFARLLDVLPEAVRLLPDGPAWWSTGPLILSLLLRQTTVQVPDAAIIAARFPRGTELEAVEEARRMALARDGGLLIDWKSW